MSLVSKLAKFARTPQGRKLTDQALRKAKDPRTRAQIQQLTGRGKRR
ncbi:MAG TPA: hypothetical protein VN238_10800 [Solirubrobacteraceae bacterium]|nr:hypothetical protein [Solirubrobacteraceae bacterium]